MKIISIIGARPQFIKVAAVCRAFERVESGEGLNPVDHIILHTGQHYDENLSRMFFEELDIPNPAHNLGIGSASHGAQTGKMLEAVEGVLVEEAPDRVLVYGDTNTTLAGALAAVKLHIPVAHIEAGLRSFNRRMPEEINRLLTDHIADLHLCPTATAVANLKAEGVIRGVEFVGDVMFDCAIYYTRKVTDSEGHILEKYGLRRKGYYLATIHRPENTDHSGRLRSILRALDEIASPECPVILPLHPRTDERLRGLDYAVSADVRVQKPVSYLEMIALERNARTILSDSGGIQKEAYFHRVPCVTLRDETEWVETVDMKVNILSGADTERIVHAARELETADILWDDKTGIFGNGDAADVIVTLLVKNIS